MYRTELEVVNACIATMGEAPLQAINDDHVYKQAALNYLHSSNAATQKRPWWFNTEYHNLLPDATSKYVYVPQDVIHVSRLSRSQAPFAQRGRRLFNSTTNTYEWDQPVACLLVRLLPFEDLPFYAQDSVSFDAILRFQREYDGDNTRFQQLDADRRRALIELNAQHIREKKFNLLDTMTAEGKTFIGAYNYRRSGPLLPYRDRYGGHNV